MRFSKGMGGVNLKFLQAVLIGSNICFRDLSKMADKGPSLSEIYWVSFVFGDVGWAASFAG